MRQRPSDLKIEAIDVEPAVEGVHYGIGFRVGEPPTSAGKAWKDDVVTDIEAFMKFGMTADIPYVRVWCGDRPVAEFCQHNIIGVYFKRGE